MKEFTKYLKRVQTTIEYGNSFDSSNLSKKYRKYYGTDTILAVKVDGKVISGTIDVSIGWKPHFVLRSKSGEIQLNYQSKIIGLK